jgi:signal recognition particle GTPase
MNNENEDNLYAEGGTPSAKKQIEIQMKKAFFDKLTEDFNATPPKTGHISLCDSLCKFVPSKTNIHKKIQQELLIKDISLETMSHLILSLIKWIEMFQAPVYDKKTKDWKNNLVKCDNCTNYLINFLKEYYEHIELVYKEVCEARHRLINGESVIPPEHRPTINSLADIKMKSGK